MLFFSFVIPVYNVDKYIEDSVKSILKQTYCNFEIVLVNDGSSDNSGALCDELSAKDSRIKSIHQKNQGAAVARNTGIDAAVGEYIVFLDGDDWIEHDYFLQDLKDKLDSAEYDMVIYKSRKYFEKTGLMAKCTYTYVEHDEPVTATQVIAECVKNDAFYCAAWLKCVKRSSMIQNNVHFYSGIIGEDQEWYLHLLACNLSIGVINKPYVCYRQRDGSVTRQKNVKVVKDLLFILNKWGKYYKEMLMEESAYSTAVLGGMAKLYSNALICAARMRSNLNRTIYLDLKNLAWVFDYAIDKRSKILSLFVETVGVKNTIMLLSLKKG